MQLERAIWMEGLIGNEDRGTRADTCLVGTDTHARAMDVLVNDFAHLRAEVITANTEHHDNIANNNNNIKTTDSVSSSSSSFLIKDILSSR